MATNRIETQLAIKAIDQFSGTLKKMRTVTGRFADDVRSEMGQLQTMRGPLRLIEDFRKTQNEAQESASALEAARKKVRDLQRDLIAVERPTEKMRKEFQAAGREVAQLERAVDRNGSALNDSRVALRNAGINTTDLAGEQRRLASALDGATTAFGRQMDRMRRLETMQTRIAESRERMERSLATAANLSFVGNASMQTGRRILTGASGVANRSGGLEAQFADFQNLTGVDDSRIVKLRGELEGLRDVTKSSVADMLDGLGVLVGKGMNFEDALAALPATGRAAKATKTQFDEMGASGFALFDNLKVAPEELRKAFDVMAQGGKEGGFELSAMARKFPEITAGARSLKIEGLDSVAQLTAALQVSMKSAGSEDAAATNLSNFLGKLTSPETVRNFEKFGISVERELKKAAERGVSPMEHMLQVIDQVTGGDAIRMGQLFGDKQVLDFLRAMIPNMEEYRRIKEASLSADGVVDKDLAELMDTFNESKKQLGESIGNLFTLPPEVMETLTDLFVKADAIVEKMILWKKEHPQLTKYLFLGATAVGAMAVAGGALLTAAAGLIGTMAVLRFGMAGLGARAVFAAGDLIGVGSAFRGLTRLPRFALSKLLAPVRWTARLISKLPWARLVGRLLLSSLIIPLRWTAALLPGFAPALARFTGFRRDASAEISKLSKHVDRESASMRRSLSGIRWGRLFKFAGLAGVAYTALQPTELGDGTVTDDVRNTNPDKIRESQIRGMYVVPNDLPDQQKNAAEVVQGVRRNGDLPTEAARDGLRGSVASIQSDIARMRAEIDKLGASPADVAMASSLQQTIQAREVELQKVRQELAAAETLAGDLTSALQLLNGTNTAPEINTESIDRAIDKIIELTSRMEVLPYAGTGPRPIPKPAIPPLAGARASGGPVYANAPYLVNENTPRSEVFVPSQSGGILNVSQAQMALRSYLMTAAPSRPAKRSADLARLNRGAQGLRAASLAVLTSSALAAPVAAQSAQSVKQGLGAVTVQIENFTVQVPSGVSDPQAIADLVADQIGQRVAATVSASFSD